MAARLAVCLALIALLLTGCGAACGPGQTCVPDAGVSVALPAGWSVKGSAGKDELLRAESSLPSVGIVIQRGDAILEAGPLQTLEEVEAAVAAEFAPDTDIGFGFIDESVLDKVTLPIGPAVRDRLTWTRSFILSYSYSSTAYWFFVDGQLLELEYDEAWGEGGSALPPETEPAELRSILDSLHRMTPEMQTAGQAAAVLPWLVAGALGLLVVGATAGVMAVLRRRRLRRSGGPGDLDGAGSRPSRDLERYVRATLPPFDVGVVGSLIWWLWLRSMDREADGGPILLLFLLGPVVIGLIAGRLSAERARMVGLIVGLAGACVGILAGSWLNPVSSISDPAAIRPMLLIASALLALGYGFGAMEAPRATSPTPRLPGPSWPMAPGRSDGAVGAVGTAEPLHRRSTARAAGYAPTLLAFTALGMWLVANALPAAVERLGTSTSPGFRYTVGGWDFALIASDYLALIGWTANLWLLGAVGIRVWHRRREPSGHDHLVAAMAATIIAMGCACLAVVALSLSRWIVSIEIGTAIWVASILVFAGSTAWWAEDRKRRARAIDGAGVRRAAPATGDQVSAPQAAVRDSAPLCGRCGRVLLTSWREGCGFCGAFFSSFPPVPRQSPVAPR